MNEFENFSHKWIKIRTILGTDESPRLEPEAEWNNGNGWSKVDTEAEEVSHVFNYSAVVSNGQGNDSELADILATIIKAHITPFPYSKTFESLTVSDLLVPPMAIILNFCKLLSHFAVLL